MFLCSKCNFCFTDIIDLALWQVLVKPGPTLTETTTVSLPTTPSLGTSIVIGLGNPINFEFYIKVQGIVSLLKNISFIHSIQILALTYHLMVKKRK